jgi:hypothetical protein
VNDFAIVQPVIANVVKQSRITRPVIANVVKQSRIAWGTGLLHFVRNDETVIIRMENPYSDKVPLVAQTSLHIVFFVGFDRRNIIFRRQNDSRNKYLFNNILYICPRFA